MKFMRWKRNIQVEESEWPFAFWLVDGLRREGDYNFMWILKGMWPSKIIFCTQHDVQHSVVHKGVPCKHIFIKKLTSVMLKPESISIVGTSDFILPLKKGYYFTSCFYHPPSFGKRIDQTI